MPNKVTARRLVQAYQWYVSLLHALGFQVDDGALVQALGDSPQSCAHIAAVLRAYRRGELNGELVDAGALERLEGLCEDLASKLASGPAKASPSWREVAESVRKLPEQERDALADMVLLDGHRAFVQRRYIGVEEFQRLLREFAGDQTVARKKLISHLREEFRRRGIDMSCDTIEERFRARPTVRSMPYCVKHILRNLGEEFRTGLIPIEKLVGNEEPDVWLERARKRLRFRSQSAMHKAIAAATGIRYDSVQSRTLTSATRGCRWRRSASFCRPCWGRFTPRRPSTGPSRSAPACGPAPSGATSTTTGF